MLEVSYHNGLPWEIIPFGGCHDPLPPGSSRVSRQFAVRDKIRFLLERPIALVNRSTKAFSRTSAIASV